MLTNISLMNDKYSIDIQHDAQEYLNDILNEINKNEKNMFKTDEICKLFETNTVITRYCKSCNHPKDPSPQRDLINIIELDENTTNISLAINKHLTCSNNTVITHFKCMNINCAVPTEKNEVRILY